MRKAICDRALLLGGFLLIGPLVWGQSLNVESQESSRLDVALTYNPVLANVTTPSGFGMQGSSMQLQAKVWRGLGAVADLAGLHAGNINNTGVSLDLVTATFGPRYTWSPRYHGRITLFGQVLIGKAYGLDGLFPSSTTINSTGSSFALQIGGGINFPLTRHFTVRALDANWLRTQLPNAATNVQNSLRLGAGVVYRVK